MYRKGKVMKWQLYASCQFVQYLANIVHPDCWKRDIDLPSNLQIIVWQKFHTVQ